jgi:HSP20 family molecular chaperone IbpA
MGTVNKKKKVEKYNIVPSTGISETGISFKIICQLPGISEEEIKIDREGTQLVISTSDRNATLVQSITVPADSYIRQKKFRDGTLEIILERPF